jgi:hypothetical protein
MKTATKSLREVAYPKPLRECGIEELAVHQLSANPSGGVLFARKQEHEQKDLARIEVLRLFGPDKFFKGLSILTMPGLEWKFERKLLGRREGNWTHKKGPHRTHLTCIENDRSIFHAAITQMPGLQQKTSFVKVLSPTAFAERGVMNRWVGRYFFGNVDDLMAAQPVSIDAAWLDYTGPLSIKRMEVIENFFRLRIRSTLVLTSLKARWNRDTVTAIDRKGSHSAWVCDSIKGRVLHDINYQDGGSPMSQIAFLKIKP